MRPPDLTGLPALAEQVDLLASQVAGAVIHAIHLDHAPPATVLMCERNLWRWSWQLRHTPANLHARRTVPDATPDVPRRVAVVLLVDLEEKKDLDLVGRDVLATSGRAGDGWQVIHTSVHPDPTRLITCLADRDDEPAPVSKLRGRSR